MSSEFDQSWILSTRTTEQTTLSGIFRVHVPEMVLFPLAQTAQNCKEYYPALDFAS